MTEHPDQEGFGPGNVVAFRPAPPKPGDYVAPAAPEAEQALIGSVLLRPETYGLVAHLVAAEHFHEDLHRRVWATITAVAQSGDAPGAVAVFGALGPLALATDLGTGLPVRAYLTRLMGECALPANADLYARAIQECFHLRNLFPPPTPAQGGGGFVPATMLAQVYAGIDAVRASFVERKVMSASAAEAGDELVSRIAADLQGQSRLVPGTGIVAFDREIGGGPQPSTLITLAARTSMGKSILGTEIASAIARTGALAIYHSLEMTRQQVMARRVSSHLFSHGGVRIPFPDMLANGRLSPGQADSVAGAVHDLRAHPFHIEDGGSRTIGEIAASSDRLANLYARRRTPLGLVVIDHAHIVKPGRAYNRQDEALKEVADGALALAKHLDVPVLLLAQCNRNVEGKEDRERRPTLADIRGAGAFEENSDVVCFLYRSAYYLERSTAFREGQPSALDEFEGCRHLLEIIIDKNRAGRSNQVVRAWIDPALNAVRNLQPGA